jgi:hypothetical protein
MKSSAHFSARVWRWLSIHPTDLECRAWSMASASASIVLPVSRIRILAQLFVVLLMWWRSASVIVQNLGDKKYSAIKIWILYTKAIVSIIRLFRLVGNLG